MPRSPLKAASTWSGGHGPSVGSAQGVTLASVHEVAVGDPFDEVADLDGEARAGMGW
jgi:hypothetical protein